MRVSGEDLSFRPVKLTLTSLLLAATLTQAVEVKLVSNLSIPSSIELTELKSGAEAGCTEAFYTPTDYSAQTQCETDNVSFLIINDL